MPLGPRAAAVLAALLLSAHFALALAFARHNAPVWDEVPTFAQGLYLGRSGRWDIPGSINHPPLSGYLQSLPLAFVGLEEGKAWTLRQPPENPAMMLFWRATYDVARGQGLLYGNAQRHAEDFLILLTRLPTLLLSLAGSVLLWRWARRLHGEWGGLLTLVLWLLSPNLIAHGALATTDAPFTVFVIATAYSFALAWDRTTAARILACGTALGLACLSKYTALLLAAPMGGLALIAILRHPGPERLSELKRAFVLLAGVALTAVLVLSLGYQGHPGNFLDGVRYQNINVTTGQVGMAMGQLSRTGWWWYYPFVLLVKTPLGLLALSGLGLWSWLARERLSQRLLLALSPFLFLLLFFLFKRLAVGVRHVLPVYAALALAAGAVAAIPWRRRRLQLLVVGGLLAFDAADLARSHPHQIGYFNPLSGGARNGWRLLADSSVDWGQDLKDLRSWMQRQGLERIQLGYFGTADPSYYGIAYDALPSMYLKNLSTEPRMWPPQGLIAVSSTCYWGLCDVGPPWVGSNPYAFLAGREPREVVGTSILIFDLQQPAATP